MLNVCIFVLSFHLLCDAANGAALMQGKCQICWTIGHHHHRFFRLVFLCTLVSFMAELLVQHSNEFTIARDKRTESLQATLN